MREKQCPAPRPCLLAGERLHVFRDAGEKSFASPHPVVSAGLSSRAGADAAQGTTKPCGYRERPTLRGMMVPEWVLRPLQPCRSPERSWVRGFSSPRHQQANIATRRARREHQSKGLEDADGKRLFLEAVVGGQGESNGFRGRFLPLLGLTQHRSIADIAGDMTATVFG